MQTCGWKLFQYKYKKCVAAISKAIKLWSANYKIDSGKKKIDDDKENKNDGNEFPLRQIEHIIKNAEPFAERHAFFYQIETAVFINKPAAGVIAVAGKAGIIVLFGKGVYFFIEWHNQQMKNY